MTYFYVRKSLVLSVDVVLYYGYLLGVVILGFVNVVWEVKMAQSIEYLNYELGDPELDSWQE
jgi:hypothetical protein